MNSPQPQIIHYCLPGDFCVFCPCLECRKFFSYKKPITPDEVVDTRLYKYSDMAFVNSMRAKFAKRQEEREEKLRAERAKPTSKNSPKTGKEETEKTIKKRRKGPRYLTCAKNRRNH